MSDRMRELTSKLSDIHDKIKSHPYRDSFAEEFVDDYKFLCYEMTRVWADMIYRGGERTEEEQQLWRQFGYWIHDYRAELRTYVKGYFPMKYFDYYEQMLQATHEFLKTGDLPTFYNIDAMWDEGGARKLDIERYVLVTKEMCGVDSPMLPRFLPTRYTLISGEQEAWEQIKKMYPFNRWEKSKQEEFFASWKKDVKPVLDWLNAQHEETLFKHSAWKSLKPIC